MPGPVSLLKQINVYRVTNGNGEFDVIEHVLFSSPLVHETDYGVYRAGSPEIVVDETIVESVLSTLKSEKSIGYLAMAGIKECASPANKDV